MIPQLKPYPQYKPSGIEWLGDVPEHWEIRKIRKSVKTCINGIWGNDADGKNDMICIRVADFDRNLGYVNIKNPTLRSIPLNNIKHNLLQQGDLLLEKSGGGDRQPVGMVVIYNHQFKAVCSNFIARLPVSIGYNPYFLNFLHRMLYSIGLNIRSIKQTTGLQNLNTKSYLSELVAFPPLSEQNAIAKFLKCYDSHITRLINNRQKLISLLNEQKQAIINQYVTGKIDARTGKPYARYKPSGIEWLGDVPEHWEIAKFSKSIRNIESGTRENFNGNSLNGIPSLGGEHIGKDGKLILKNLKYVSILYFEKLNKGIIKENDILLVKDGATIGKVALIKKLPFNKCAVNEHIFVLRANEKCIPEFLYYAIKNEQFQNEIWKIVTGSAQPRLNSDFIKKISIPFPLLSEQNAIVEYLNNKIANFDSAIDSFNLEISLLREYRTRLIADVVTGKLDVRDVASKLPDIEEVEEEITANLAEEAMETEEITENRGEAYANE